MNGGDGYDIQRELLSIKDYSQLKVLALSRLKEKKISVDDVCGAAETLMKRGRFKEAAGILRHLIENDFASEEIFILLIDVLTKQKEYDQAAEISEKGTDRFQGSARINIAAGLSAMQGENYAKAEKFFSVAVKREPQSFEAHFYLGGALRFQGKLDEAEREYLTATKLNTLNDSVYYNLGVVSEKQNKFDDAKKYYEKAIELNYENAEAHWNYALLLLSEKNYSKGWEEFEWRLKKREFARNDLPFAYWDGSALDGKRILLYDEQGFGDAIQFARFVKYLRKYKCVIDCECKKELTALFKVTGLFDDVFERKSKRFEKSDYHYKASLLSMPFLLNVSTHMIEITKPYIKVI